MKRVQNIYSIVIALFSIGMAANAFAQDPAPNIRIGGSVYGGGALASVQTNTNVVINDGQFEQDIYGGGKGELDDKTVKASADVTGNTAVTVNGGTFTFPKNGIDENVNHNVYGGGNLACNVGGNTNVTMNAGILPEGFYESESWTNWKNDFDAQNDNVAQGSVFGAGYGVHTSVAGTATIVVNANSTSLIDVIGGSYNGTVAGSTDVTVQSGNIYKVYGGGLGSYAGYDDATTQTLKDNLGSVGTDKGNGTYTGGTNVTIQGGKFYNNIFGGGAGLKYNGGTSYLNVAKVNGTANVTIDAPAWIAGDKFSKNIYGGGALGLVADAISVTLKSGEFDGAQVFGGSLGEDRHADNKAKVTGNTHVRITHNDATPTPDALKGHLDIYGGCDMAQVDGNTSVTVEYGTFYGSIFGGGLGRGTTYLGDNAEANKDYGKVTGNTNVIIDGGADWEMLTLGAADKYTAVEASAANEANGITEGEPGYVREGDYKTPIKVYGGSALGLIGGTLDVKLKSGTLYGEMFGGSLGELGYVEKAKVMTTATISTEAGSSDPETGKPYPLNGLFNIYGGCDMAQIQNNTHVNLQHGTFSGNIFGGGKGVEETAGTEVGREQFVNYGKVTGTTNVLINGPQMTLGKATLYTAETAATANNAHLIKNNGIEPGQPGYIKKYDNEWLEVKAGDAATIDEEIKIYGGGALGLVDGIINTVNLQSGTLYGEVFGGSLGELGYLAKAKVTGNVGVKTTANDTKDSDGVTPKPDALNGKFTIYGGCEIAQVIGTTEVDIQHGTFLGGIFGGGKGLASAVDGEGNVTDDYKDYGKVEAQNASKAACKVTFESDGSFGGDIYGGGALGLVETSDPENIKPTHITEVHLKKGVLNGKVFGAGLGEKINADKAKVKGDTWVITDIPTDPATEILGGNINHVFGGGNMAQVDGNTKVEIIHGSFSGTIFGGGNGVAEDPGTPAGSEKYLNFGKVTETTHVVIDGPTLKLGSVEGTYTAETAAIANAASGARENAYNYWKEGDDIITSTMSVYGGGALGMVGKNITVEVKSGEIYGDIFAGSLGELGYVKKAKVTADAEHTVTIGTYANTNSDALTGVFSMYGGCDMAQFEGNSKVDIQHGAFRGQIFGGGRGVSCAENGGEEKYGIVKGTTKVLFHSDGSFNGDIYGGGALGLVDPGTEPLPEYTTQVRLVYGNINGQVFGGGFGETTNYDSSSDEPAKLAALNTAKITGNTLVVTDDPESNVLGGEINHVYGGGNMATVDGNTRVEISHGSFSGTIFGGGNGVPSNAVTGEEYLAFGKVTGTTNVLIDGKDLKLGTADYYTQTEADDYNRDNDLHDGDPDYKTTADVKTVTSEMQIYGGGAMGMVDSNISVDVKSGKIFGAVFAGSMGEEGHINKALVKSNSTQSTRVHLLANSNNDPLTGHFSVYGGCDLAMFEGESEVVINHGTFTGKIFGGGNGWTSAECGAETRYGQIKGVTRVIYDNDGTFNGDIYGGGAMGKIVPDAEAHLPALATDPITTVYLSKGTINGQVFGGSLGEKIDVDKAEVVGNTLVTTDVPNEYIDEAGRIGGRIENFFGGGDMARVTGDTYVTLTRGHFNGRIFGGGNGVPSDSKSEYLEFGKVTGNTHVLVDRKNDEGNVLQLGENEKYTALEATTHNTALSATPGDVDYVQEGDYKKPMKIYGGGALGKVGGTINIAIKNGNHYGEVFGGSLGEKGHPNKALVTGNTNAWAVANKLVDDDPTKPANDALPLTGDLKFYGGCEMARVEGQSKVTINHGSFSGAIYGGGKGIPTYNSETYIEYGKVVGSGAVGSKASIVEFNNEHGTFTGNIYGGGALGKIESGLANVQMLAGNVKGNVYGGSYGENTLPEKGTAAATLVEMLGGNVLADNTDATLKGEIYGGGALANVAGNTEVHLYGGTVGGDVFGGGLGNANTAQKVGGNTLVNLGKKNNPSDTSNTPERSASEVGGSIFGCNNVNGTPEGHAKVHVIKTQSRASQASPANAADVENSYDVLAVYGGGNKAAYQPSNATITAGNGYAEVLIEYCDNSIAYVYGGGNAAPVPATQVRIYGANAIDHAFAGGNGKGVNNDGADVGYLNYYSTQTPAAIEYGSGTASIGVYGGTVHNVYGGSNTLGYIRTSASVNVETPKADDPYIACAHGCELNVSKTFGGGNMADMIGNINMRLDCTEGADIIFAGANNANVYGNIHLTVNSGTFRQVFCSNNQGGAVFGKLRLDVDETGCTPIIIKELFGGGNLAPYSVYGYKTVDGNLVPRTKQEFDALADGEKTGLPYADPVVNVTSCTAIGTIYGGGFGSTAEVYGNPIVNVDMVKGAFADRKLNSSNHNKQIVVIKDGILQTETEITIPDAIGTIGNIFGGGKQADVYGNTTVNVCVKDADPTLKNRNDNSEATTSAFIAPFKGDMALIMSYSDADKTAHDEPSGNIYGGGKMANVYGNTKVHIRNGNIEGDVFGASQGDAAQPDAALVKGKTEVIIGE